MCDDDNAYATQLGLKHGFADDLKGVYGQFGIDLDNFNGNSKWELAIPSRFVVAKDGTIAAVDTNANYTLRPEPTETIEVLKSIA